MSRLVFGFMWLVRFLPLGVIAAIGSLVGRALFWLIAERRRVVRINLEKCFPQMPRREREKLARAHFRAFGRSFIERGILWWSRRSRIQRIVRIDGIEHLKGLAGARVIVFAPHFVGLDAALSRLTTEFTMCGMYAKQKDPLFDRLLERGRTRFGGEGFSRQQGLRASLRPMKSGALYYYLPDLDFGRKHSLFAPFFGVQAATLDVLPQIARLTRAVIVPCVARMLPGGGGYVAQVYPAWSGFPSGDDAADVRRMLAFIEERVLEAPEQYYWLHKRFKTRPEGEAGFY
jgi:Kdo2-lipid IVA lauroyltransferase/acyltransferase